MPAYRSSAEADIRDPVVARLRVLVPGCRIIHEINFWSGPHTVNRIDVLAVSQTRIVAVEIKSERDKIDRLPDQIAAMRQCSHHVIAALHEKFLTRGETAIGPLWSAPKECRGAKLWPWPEAERKGLSEWGKWNLIEPREKTFLTPPSAALDLLWRDELREIVARRGLTRRGTSGMNMAQLSDAIRWNMTGQDVTRDLCRALRFRKCTEADPAIEPAMFEDVLG